MLEKFKALPKPVKIIGGFFLVAIILGLLSGCVANLPQEDCPDPLVKHPGTNNDACIKPAMKFDFLPEHTG